MHRFRTALLLIFVFIACGLSFGQTAADSRVSKGVELFGAEKYSDALDVFNRLLSDPGANSLRADALYWSSLSYIALGNTDNARRTMDAFLKEFPRNAQVPDALYQRARLSYMAGEYEDAIRLFGSFLESYPDHRFASSALFWTGDSLFSLGRLQESESLFRTIVKDYPTSVKYEAANYKLSLIRLKYRENELLTLLKWSHEESLRVIEEFQRREKAYEQALSVYQRRLAEAGGKQPTDVGIPVASGDSESRIAALNSRIDELTLALASAHGGAVESACGKEELLGLKSQALDLLASYLDWLAQNKEKEVRP